MILSKSKKFLFIRVPKTGSTSLYYQILKHVPYCEIDIHTKINFLLSLEDHDRFKTERFREIICDDKIVYPDYNNLHPNINYLLNSEVLDEKSLIDLNVYGIIREPIDRIISCASHIFIKNIQEFESNDQLIEQFLIKSDKMVDEEDPRSVLLRRQSYWLKHNNSPINKIFRYDQINLMAKELCGVENIEYSFRSKIRKDKSSNISKELLQECRKRYSEDFDLWESLQPPTP